MNCLRNVFYLGLVLTGDNGVIGDSLPRIINQVLQKHLKT